MAQVWSPFFKPNRLRHNSGYRCFDIGYIENLDGNKSGKKIHISRRTDHITVRNIEKFSLNFDVLDGGEIRFFNGYRWQGDMSLSSMTIEKGVFIPTEEQLKNAK